MKSVISALSARLLSGEITAARLTEDYISQIEKINPQINAYVHTTFEEARADAEYADRLIKEGKATPLTGIPFTLKDNIATDGLLTTCCSKILQGLKPYYDATVWKKLKAQGAVLLGKTNMDEFAMGSTSETSCYGAPLNPIDKSKVTGGSSGGVAAAVCANIAAYGLGSDTGGSIRQPASFCGVTGIKPTYGRVSRYGLVAFGSSLDQIGPIANTAEDCGEILNVISGHDAKDATSARLPEENFNAKIGQSVKGVKIALPKEFYGEAVEPEVREAVINAAKTLEKQGAVLTDCEMPSLKYGIPAYYLIACAEAASNLSRFDGIKYGLRGEGKNYREMILDSRNKGFGDEVKRRILLGNYALSSGYFDAYYRKACALRQRIIAEYNSIFEEADVVLTPTAPSAAYKIGSQDTDPVKMYTADILTVPVNIAGLPGISTTCGRDKDGMPIGMSIVGKKFDEATLLQLADAFEREVSPIYN